MHELAEYIFFIGQGVGITLLLLLGSLIIGLGLGMSLAIACYQGKYTWFITKWVSVMRGTPMMLQLSFVYFVLPALLKINLDMLLAGILAFGFNSAAYLAEIFRAGIEGVPKGQFQAARSLGVPTFYLWKDIVLPQVFQGIWPALVNEVITLTKETALISVIGGMDIMRSAQVISAEHFTYFMPLCIAAVYYYLLVYAIECLSKLMIKKGVIYAQSNQCI